MSRLPNPPPPPLEWHPYYADKTFLLDWLEGEGQYAHLNTQILVPKPVGLKAFMVEPGDEVPESAVAFPRLTIVKHRAAAPAPYTGPPFVYWWWVGIDDYGRAICSDVHYGYLPPQWWQPPDEFDASAKAYREQDGGPQS